MQVQGCPGLLLEFLHLCTKASQGEPAELKGSEKLAAEDARGNINSTSEKRNKGMYKKRAKIIQYCIQYSSVQYTVVI